MTNQTKVIIGVGGAIIGTLTFLLIRTKKDLTNMEDWGEAAKRVLKHNNLMDQHEVQYKKIMTLRYGKKK